MSPEIKEINKIENKETRDKFLYFSFELKNPEKFDREYFDALAKNINYDGSHMSDLKFIVLSDSVYVFSESYLHSTAYHLLKSQPALVEAQIQCAGDLKVYYVNGKFRNTDNYRRLTGSSISLNDEGILNAVNSDKYKNEVLAKAGFPFEVS